MKLGDLVITRLLVKSGIDVDIMDNSGNTARMVADKSGHRQIVDLLKDNWDGDPSWLLLHDDWKSGQ